MSDETGASKVFEIRPGYQTVDPTVVPRFVQVDMTDEPRLGLSVNTSIAERRILELRDAEVPAFLAALRELCALNNIAWPE